VIHGARARGGDDDYGLNGAYQGDRFATFLLYHDRPFTAAL
jgi:hypothetical protein